MTSAAYQTFETAIGHAQRLMEGTKTGRGKPSKQETTMFVAAVALSYAAWEAYVEDLAVELVAHMAAHTPDAKVPDTVRKAIVKHDNSVWGLAISPGWREIWKTVVKLEAKGSDDDGPPFGMNTAKPSAVIKLFGLVGIGDPWQGLHTADKDAIHALVTDRGTVVHTAGTPENFNKNRAKRHLEHVERIVEAMDSSVAIKAQNVSGSRPW